MNKTAIRNFAVWARNKLIADISYRAGLMGVTKDGIANALPQSTKDVEFYDIGMAEPYAINGIEIKQRKALADAINRKAKDSDYNTAYTSVIEEVAYTWFNRLIAVRFMEVNDYLPARVRVLSSESGKNEPDLVTTPFDADLEFTGAEEQTIIQLKQDNQLDDLFRMLFIKQCNALHEILPRMFEKTGDYTELLLNISFVDQESVVWHLVHDIPEEDFDVERGGQVEIIGWLYQYYNAELKDETFALLKRNVKVTKERIPSATQLFTPDWIVRYMVENSLGRLWIEGHPDDSLKANWKYYLDEAEQEPEVQAQLESIRKEYAALNPEDIKIIDPCMGSGHILVYAFDVLMQIYESCGWSQRDAAKSILENNLYGLDIDDRAAQLAYFSVMMKARQYNRRIFNIEILCNLYAIQESNTFDRICLIKLGELRNNAEKILDIFRNAKEYGSILSVDLSMESLVTLYNRINELKDVREYEDLIDGLYTEILLNQMQKFVTQAIIMRQKYDVVITNPPYMGSGNMNNKLASYTKKEFPESRYDFSTIFMQKVFEYCKSSGLVSMINIPVWMFLSRYEKFRNLIVFKHSILNMIHCGRGIFGSDFGTTTFLIANKKYSNYIGTYKKLFEKQSSVSSVDEIESLFLKDKRTYCFKQEDYLKIPGAPLAYWINNNELDAFRNGKSLKKIAPPRVGIITGNNEVFIKTWWEVEGTAIKTNTSKYEDSLSQTYKWYPYNKGGAARDWYGNRELIVNFKHGGEEIKMHGDTTGAFYFLGAQDVFFHRGITWSGLTIGRNTFRFSPEGTLFDSNKGPMVYPNTDEELYYLLGLFNTKVVQRFLSILNPTVSLQAGDFEKMPILYDNNRDVINNSVDSVKIAQEDYDSFETSMDFKKHPLI